MLKIQKEGKKLQVTDEKNLLSLEREAGRAKKSAKKEIYC